MAHILLLHTCCNGNNVYLQQNLYLYQVEGEIRDEELSALALSILAFINDKLILVVATLIKSKLTTVLGLDRSGFQSSLQLNVLIGEA